MCVVVIYIYIPNYSFLMLNYLFYYYKLVYKI